MNAEPYFTRVVADEKSWSWKTIRPHNRNVFFDRRSVFLECFKEDAATKKPFDWNLSLSLLTLIQNLELQIWSWEIVVAVVVDDVVAALMMLLNVLLFFNEWPLLLEIFFYLSSGFHQILKGRSPICLSMEIERILVVRLSCGIKNCQILPLRGS